MKIVECEYGLRGTLSKTRAPRTSPSCDHFCFSLDKKARITTTRPIMKGRVFLGVPLEP